MFVPPRNESNEYYSLLHESLQSEDVSQVDYSWNSLLPLLAPMLRGGRPEVVHLHWLAPVLIGRTRLRTGIKGIRLFVSLLAIKLAGVRVVWTVHNLTSHQRRHPRYERAWRVFIANIVANHLVVHCDAAATAVREEYRIGDRTPVTTIPHGHYVGQYPESMSRDQAREAVGAADDEVVFTFFGQIRPYKQVPTLVETFVELDADRARLVVAGNPIDGALERRIESLCADRPAIETRLEFVPDEEVAQYFLAADAVVLPYRDILTSGSAILALSFARPVIAPRIGCLPELIDDGTEGFLYGRSDPGGLQQAMARALEANDLQEMGKRGYEAVASRDWASVAERTRCVYEPD